MKKHLCAIALGILMMVPVSTTSVNAESFDRYWALWQVDNPGSHLDIFKKKWSRGSKSTLHCRIPHGEYLAVDQRRGSQMTTGEESWYVVWVKRADREYTDRDWLDPVVGTVCRYNRKGWAREKELLKKDNRPVDWSKWTDGR